jgi:hypothetical protein
MMPIKTRITTSFAGGRTVTTVIRASIQPGLSFAPMVWTTTAMGLLMNPIAQADQLSAHPEHGCIAFRVGFSLADD